MIDFLQNARALYVTNVKDILLLVSINDKPKTFQELQKELRLSGIDVSAAIMDMGEQNRGESALIAMDSQTRQITLTEYGSARLFPKSSK